MKKLTCLVLALLLTLALAAGACAEEATYKIGICENNLTNPFRVAEFNQALDWFEEHPECELVYTAAKNDVTTQIADLEDLIAQDCDLILINCINEDALTPTLLLAKEKGIPVMCWDRVVSNYDLRVAAGMLDNYNDFKEYGRRVVDVCKDMEHAKIFLCMGVAGTPVTNDRQNGILDGIAETGADNIEVIGIDYCNNARADAIEILESVVLANPDIAVLCMEIDETAQGAIQVLRQNDMLDKVKVFGCDGQKEALEAIMNGEQEFTIKTDTNPFLLIHMLDLALDYLDDGVFQTELSEHNLFYGETHYVDASNAADYYDPDAPF